MNTLQAQQGKWAVSNQAVDYATGYVSNLPYPDHPDMSQNALFDTKGRLEFTVADGRIRDASGVLILGLWHADFGKHGDTARGFSEEAIVPVPETCDEYYVISTYTEGTINNGNFLAYGRLKKINGVWTPQTMANSTLVEKWENSGCDFVRSAPEEENGPDGTFTIPDVHNHIAVTRINPAGNRYLFMSVPRCIGVFEIRNDDIHFIGHSNGQTYTYFHEANRSEMEVYEYEPVNNDASYTLATCYYADPDLDNGAQYHNKGGAVHLWDVTITGTSVNFTSDYQVKVPKTSAENDYRQCINGLEFSDDGLTLYATYLMWEGHTQPLNYIYDRNLIYFTRLAQYVQFGFNSSNIILSGAATHDFAFGQIERGRDGKLYVAGNRRLGALADNNDPNSTFDTDAIAVGNNLTYADKILPHTSLKNDQEAELHLYLLNDQIDGEDYSIWSTGPLDLFPDTVYGYCQFPDEFNFGEHFYIQTGLSTPTLQDYVNITEAKQVVNISRFDDMSCSEQIVFTCCPGEGAGLMCVELVYYAVVYNADNTAFKLHITGCDWDVPPPCVHNFSYTYYDPAHPSGPYVTVNFTAQPHVSSWIPVNAWNQNSANLQITVYKELCFDPSCGESTIIVDEDIPVTLPEE
jgi:hypothetical protein